MTWYEMATWGLDGVTLAASGVAVYYAVQAGRSARKVKAIRERRR